jgi:hypothetical protein
VGQWGDDAVRTNNGDERRSSGHDDRGGEDDVTPGADDGEDGEI